MRGAGGPAIIPRRRKPADAAADHDEIVAFVDRGVVGVKIHAAARERMRDLESAIMLAAQTGERRRIARRRRRQLLGRRQPDAIVKATPLRKSRREMRSMREDSMGPQLAPERGEAVHRNDRSRTLTRCRRGF